MAGDETEAHKALSRRPELGDLLLEGLEDVRHALKRERYKRSEIYSYGFDDFLQGAPGFDGTPSALGIRIPELAGVRYLVLAAKCPMSKGDRLVGWTVMQSIAAVIVQGEAAALTRYVEERPVVTPGWCFSDTGPTSFHLTIENKRQTKTSVGAFDQESFVLEDADSPCMVYENAHFPAVPTAPGYLGLDGYTPPGMLGTPVYTVRDIRNPWNRSRMEPFFYEADRDVTLRAYVQVPQTNPATRTKATIVADAFVTSGLVPEENFLQKFSATSRYHRAGVALLVDRRV